MNIYELRQLVGQEIVDYNQLKAALKGYAQPRKKISQWIRSGELTRVKKGLYVFGQASARGPYSLELLANLIYGPSAISLNYALAYYGLIPEQVRTITSITNKRNKEFNTPVGLFSYRYLSYERYAIGIQLMSFENKMHFLIATPEKALCDLITLALKDMDFRSEEDVERYLLEDLRIDDDALKEFNRELLSEIGRRYRSRRLSQFLKYF